MWLLVQIVHSLSWRLLASSTPCFFTYFFHTCLCLSHITYKFHLYAYFFFFLLSYFNATSFFILSSLNSLYCYFLIFLHSWSLSFLHYFSPWKLLSFFLFLSVTFSLVHFFLPALSVCGIYFLFLFLPYFSFSREEAWCFSKHELVKQITSDIAVTPEHISCSCHLISNWHAAICTSEICPSSTRFDA